MVGGGAWSLVRNHRFRHQESMRNFSEVSPLKMALTDPVLAYP
jgi:hypothetical protein